MSWANNKRTFLILFRDQKDLSIIALRQEQLLLAQLEPEQVHLEDRLRELKRPRCDRGNKCESDCMLDHGDDNDDAPVETRVKGKERQKK